MSKTPTCGLLGVTRQVYYRSCWSRKKKQDRVEQGMIITNPPYGERIKLEDLSGLYEMIGERLKHVFTGYTAWILSYKKECFNKIGLKHSQRIYLMNGSLECEFRKYELFSGKRNEHKKESKGGN